LNYLKKDLYIDPIIILLDNGGIILQRKFLQNEIYLTIIFLFVSASVIPTALTTINIATTDGTES
jgi:hypothetical protein